MNIKKLMLFLGMHRPWEIKSYADEYWDLSEFDRVHVVASICERVNTTEFNLPLYPSEIEHILYMATDAVSICGYDALLEYEPVFPQTVYYSYFRHALLGASFAKLLELKLWNRPMVIPYTDYSIINVALPKLPPDYSLEEVLSSQNMMADTPLIHTLKVKYNV